MDMPTAATVIVAMISATAIFCTAIISRRGKSMRPEMQPSPNSQHQETVEGQLQNIQRDLAETKDTVSRLDERQKNHEKEMRRLEDQLRELLRNFQREIQRVEEVLKTSLRQP